jgi:hypothetical protein
MAFGKEPPLDLRTQITLPRHHQGRQQEREDGLPDCRIKPDDTAHLQRKGRNHRQYPCQQEDQQDGVGRRHANQAVDVEEIVADDRDVYTDWEHDHSNHAQIVEPPEPWINRDDSIGG